VVYSKWFLFLGSSGEIEGKKVEKKKRKNRTNGLIAMIFVLEL
jgi:hypothetical protein